MPEVISLDTSQISQEFNLGAPGSHEVIAWLRSKQPIFTQALAEFGLKVGYGFERARNVNSIHSFTGSGLCGLAIGAMEEGIKRNYGEDVLTNSQFIYTHRRNLVYPATICEDNIWPHWILQFKADGDWYFADPTFRQFCPSVNPLKMLIGIPVTKLEKIYGSWRIYAYMSTRNFATAGKYLPDNHPNGELHRMNMKDILGERVASVGVRDYLQLVDVFT